MTTTSLTLIDYVRRLYPQPGVEVLLLRLQDEYGLDVLLLLTACWLASRGQPVEGTDWAGICAEQQCVHQRVIHPLRAARRAVGEHDRDTELYAQIKACEQAAEWQQLERLGLFCENQGVVMSQAVNADLHLRTSCEAQGVEASATLLIHLAELAGLAARPVRMPDR
ncbi:TIGR02444 family protein [Halopseudomonas pelagia]|uniref:TIGR02444 family protein n=1 Tax=Halopseudomonas pelagia TaxID=553151 RepID=UPI0003A715FA|nr:TIGR02444 family protein [Halopseudomonas pelagia]|tara:strand:- start:1254 stop:1754 length:501 start_codon:yes stop_codon:yes gene_type:complete